MLTTEFADKDSCTNLESSKSHCGLGRFSGHGYRTALSKFVSRWSFKQKIWHFKGSLKVLPNFDDNDTALVTRSIYLDVACNCLIWAIRIILNKEVEIRINHEKTETLRFGLKRQVSRVKWRMIVGECIIKRLRYRGKLMIYSIGYLVVFPSRRVWSDRAV